jgi:hypothetical protein
MFQVAKCFIWMLHIFKCILHPSVLCFRGSQVESWGHGPGARGWSAASRGPEVGAHSTPRIPRTRHSHSHAGSRVPHAQREMRGSGEGAAGASFPMGAWAS